MTKPKPPAVATVALPELLAPYVGRYVAAAAAFEACRRQLAVAVVEHAAARQELLDALAQATEGRTR